MRTKSRAKRERCVTPDVRTVKLHPEVAVALEEQERRFREKFGRDMEPGDPIFFDPDADTPQPYGPQAIEDVKRQMVEAMMSAGIDPAKIHALQKTGMMVTQENICNWSNEDLDEYNTAIEEFNARRKQ